MLSLSALRRLCIIHTVIPAPLHDAPLTAPAMAQELASVLEPFVYEWASERRGSVSAEHGVGTLKRDVLHLSQSEPALRLMASMKRLLDPAGILNPRKVLPDAYM